MITREPVTIHGQTFVYDEKKGWIDQKTKKPANEGLIDMLNDISKPLDSPLKALRSKIDNSVDPVNIGGTTFIYDLNKGWIDSKSKKESPPHLQKILDDAVGINREEAMGLEKSIESNVVPGVAGEAAEEKVKKKPQEKEKVDEQKQKAKKPVTRVKKDTSTDISSLHLVELVEGIGSIASLMDSKLDGKKRDARRGRLKRRASLFGRRIQLPFMKDNDTNTSGGLNPFLIASVIGGISLLFEPIRDAASSFIDVAKDLIGSVTDAFVSLGSPIEWLVNNTTWLDNLPNIDWEERTKRIANDIRNGDLFRIRDATPEEQAEMDRLFTWEGFTERTGQMWDDITGGNLFRIRREDEGGTVVPDRVTPQVSEAQDAEITRVPEQERDTMERVFSVEGAPSYEGIEAVGRDAQDRGFRVSEQESFGGVRARHSGAGHREQRAIDINIGRGNVEADDPEMRARFDRLAIQYQRAGYVVLWNGKRYDPNGNITDIPANQGQHRNHMHVEAPRGGPRPTDSVFPVQREGDDTLEGLQIDESEPYDVSEGQRVQREGLLGRALNLSVDALEGLSEMIDFDTTFRATPYETPSQRVMRIHQASMMRKSEELAARAEAGQQVIVQQTADRWNMNQAGGTANMVSTTNDAGIVKQYLRYFELFDM